MKENEVSVKNTSDDTPSVTPTDSEALVYYCSWDGRVKRVKARELDQVEHGGIRTRYCKTCEQMTPHAVITSAESDDAAAVVEALIRVLNYQGVTVRRSTRDDGFYGVQVNRYDGTGWDGTATDSWTGTEAMLCGPVTAAEMVPALQGACQVADAPHSEYVRYSIGVGILGRWFDARPGRRGVMARMHLWFVFGEPAELAEQPGPAMRLFAVALRDALSNTERQALALVLTGMDAELDMQQSAVLERPADISVHTSLVQPKTRPSGSVSVHRGEVPTVVW